MWIQIIKMRLKPGKESELSSLSDALLAVEAGTLTLEQAASRMPALRRVAGACPCSKSVRWVYDEPAVVATPAAAAQPVA